MKKPVLVLSLIHIYLIIQIKFAVAHGKYSPFML